MRNSAWYHKLWRNKFDSLPVKDAADASWAGMHQLLNEQMPVSTIGGHGPNLSTGAKLFKIIGYTLSVAATVSTVVYLTVPKSKNKHKEIEKKITPAVSDSITIDSSKVLNYNDIADTTMIKDSIDQKGNAIADLTGQNRGGDHDSALVVKPTNGIENVTSTATKPNAGSSVKNKDVVTQRRDHVRLFENLGTGSSKPSSKVDVYRYKSQNADSSFTKDSSLLLVPNGFKQGNTFSNHLPSPISILTNERAVVQTYAINNLRNASTNNKRRGANNKARETTVAKTPKAKEARPPKIKTAKTKRENDITEPTYSYGITTGLNVQKGNSSFYAGISGAYALSSKWQLALGVNINSYQKIAGEFTHPSYYRPDSVPPFTIAATRKVITVDIPLTVGYKLSKHISIKAGPVISFVGKQSEMMTKLNPIADPRDTLYHSKTIDSTLVNTVNNKVNIGLTGGVSMHFKHFDINGSYQWLTPYKVSNSLGSFKQTNQVFRIGVGYRFK